MNVRRPSSPMPQQYSPSEAGPIRTKAPTPQRHQPSSWALQSAKGQETFLAEQYQAHRAFAQESTQAVLASSLPLHVGQSGAGLPLAPWPLRLCWGSPEPETHSQRVLLRGIQDWACEDLLRPGPSNATRAKLGRATPRTRLPKGTYRAPGGCSLKGDRKRSSGSRHQHQRAKTQESNKSCFRTQPTTRSPAKRGWAAPGCRSAGALQGVFGAWMPLPSWSPSRGINVARA